MKRCMGKGANEHKEILEGDMIAILTSDGLIGVYSYQTALMGQAVLKVLSKYAVLCVNYNDV